MRIVVQRVAAAEVEVAGEVVGEVGHGLLVLVGVGHASTAGDAEWLANKTEGLRVFADEAGAMNRSVSDVGGGVLAVSQFTLYGNIRKGRRPSFVDAAQGPAAESLYAAYCDALGVPCARGVFGAKMQITATCDGPVTLMLAREAGVVVPIG